MLHYDVSRIAGPGTEKDGLMVRQKKSTKRTRNKKQSAIRRSIAQWNVRLREAGLAELNPGFLPRRRRVNPLLDEEENELERGAHLNLDGSPLVSPHETECRIAVTPGAFVELTEYLRLSGVARTVLGMRLLVEDCTRENVRGYFLREHPEQAGEAMNAWRRFSEKMPEIRAFLAGYRCDREVRTKPTYRLFE